MKSIIPILALAAAVAAASPQVLAEIARDLRDRAVYPEKGQVCCRTDGENCICVANSHKDCDRGICTS
ncbi:hypothetical protein CTA2_12540 [Colletotrichum tanaceti]|uniref:Uncharacterized protein n=1 Tax=Colletotrichum tanaceti TaxID=1306861 RepID=A0A4U6XAL5_9PEZI|nr:hypothetical protein CTA2_12540 [Colletotrichum tanaceti]TKW52273.1 hypothetical protein CTA1_252 [Colletotrichum tanaceti]